MALSNWDTLAINLNGEPQMGFFVSPGGVKVEIYKNWVYVHDPKAWREDGFFVKDTVMKMEHGDVQYHDVQIKAVQGPQFGVYVACWHADYDKNPAEYTGMIGCGVSGYEDKKWVGVMPASVEFLQKWISNKERIWIDEDVDRMVAELANPDIDPKEWEKELREECVFDFPEEVAGVKLDQAIRYNQGNMYFAEKAGMSLEESKPGKSREPVIISLIDSMGSAGK